MPLGARSASLAEVLDELTREAAEELTERLEGTDVRCYACGHRCLVREGKRGICKVRFNESGRLLVPAGYVAAPPAWVSVAFARCASTSRGDCSFPPVTFSLSPGTPPRRSPSSTSSPAP